MFLYQKKMIFVMAGKYKYKYKNAKFKERRHFS
jgi:hypothetical protein